MFSLLLFSVFVFAQKEYSIEQVSAINMGDGRILFRDLKADTPLNGEHRIIDGYHSAYVLAEFKDGLFNGKYEEREYSRLKCSGSYKEGRKNGVFKYYNDEEKVKEEKSYKEDKLDGARKTYYTDGKLEREVNYRAGKQDGKDIYYDFDGTLRREHTYKDGKQVGKRFTFLKGTYELHETVYYNEYGQKDGDYSAIFTFGLPHVLGHYKNGQKDGRWTEIAENGDTLVIQIYANGKEEGLHVSYDRETGARKREYYMKADRKDGLYREYNPENGELIYEATYQYDRLHGKARQLVVTSRYDYWEISNYENGRQNGPFESRYVKNDRVREVGEYRNGRRIGRWKQYDIDGKLEKEWEETK
ncbi:MAG: toxin-antitoxin system YwqK family antitoxin [Bacteroides sp.]|nr:toxin-antitoxin system YwqK family antitoxin [Bacteroides sp.]